MNSDLFPWDGKIFEANSPYDGQGANRIRLAGERHLLRFSTRLERSILDDRPAVVLDYDEPGNFLASRRMRDELRQLTNTLFIGPAFIHLRKRHHMMFWFAIEVGGR
ncbi:MAG: hypothetical protein KC561_00515 [Myxococcales bacterium]|nr:hypothetical protein [Myxococcales bacterium]